MNKRDIGKFRNIDELWDKKLEELGLYSIGDKSEDLKEK